MSEASVQAQQSLESLVGQVADEFLRRQENGEHPDVEEYAARYPEAAELLRKVLASLQILELSQVSVSGTSAGEPAPSDLGDFRLLREVGRGGMGIVYEAEQVSLGRRVALKVLPLASTMDPHRLQRFHNEAKAAACLHHTHIVPVFAVGCERGVHFYAMQFIDGITLTRVIGDLHRPGAPAKPTDPTGDVVPGDTSSTLAAAGLSTERGRRDPEFYRSVARLMIQAAEALEHAHSMGLVHRDVKPGNLMVDAAGKLWVTDFGLARFGTDAGLTLSGDLLGTLRYMSPEQALARHGLVDHRTDVYALGATLYELLTGQPAVPGEDKQEILRQIALDEPRPARRINTAIPVELETIVLKTLEKNPADRYATAQALADDLRRNLMHEPIQARRSSLVQRARKVARRHPGVTVTVAVAMVAGLLLGIAGLAVNNRMVRQEQLRTQKALNQAEQEKKIAQAVRDFLRNKLLAQADPRVQADAVRRSGDKSMPKPNPTIHELLDRAALELTEDKIEGQFPGQPLVQAAILKTVGEAYGAIGEYDSAIPHLERARDLQIRELGPDHLDTLATMDSLAKTYLDDGKWDKAAGLFEQVRDRRIEKLGPDHPDTLASMNNLSRCYFRLGRREEALGLREQIVELRKARLGPDHPDTLESMNNLANSYGSVGRLPDALRLHAETLKLRNAKLGENDPYTLDSMNNVAICYAKLDQFAEALKLHQETFERRRSTLGADHPDTLQSMNNVAVACSALGRHAEALKLHEKTLARRTVKLHRDHPDTLQSMNAVAWILANCPDRTLRDPDRALALAKQAVELAPEKGDFQNTLGTAYYRTGDWKSAVGALTKSVNLRKGGDGTDWFFLAMAQWHLGDKDQSRSCYGKAVQWMEKHPSQDEELRQLRAEAAELLQIEKK